MKNSMDIVRNHFRGVSSEKWSEANLKDAFSQMASTLKAKWDHDGDLAHDLDPAPVKTRMTMVQHFLRWALFGGRPGPALMATMDLLGRDVSLQRIEDAAAELDAIVPETEETSAEE